ncbi:hypothetical protein [Nocardioides aequoreus]|uniref:hypothetical protein n=1 Tax=Nocardioides aequoreus TaxID=397278 RepID=UPI0004C30A51|nr:hypothetical protein [Nocardioides aequoreus]
MTAAARARHGAGCVLGAGDGLVEVLTDRGRLSATLGGAALARLAADPASAPQPGDWVDLCWWPDGPVTVDRVRRRETPRLARVLPLRRA